MDAKVEGIAIKGISSYVPENVEDNMDFAQFLGERRIKKQIRLTGIQKRHTSLKGQYASDLAAFAAEKLIADLGWSKDEIGVLILVSQERDYIIPSTAIAMQERLGLSKECVAFDINLGCSAFNYGVHTVATFLSASNNMKKGICLIADSAISLKSRRSFNVDAISFSLLAGSAATAVALEKTEDSTILFSGNCDGSNYDAIIRPGHTCDTTMKGNVVFDYAINDVSDYINAFKEKNALQEDDIDYYVFHQAQKLIVESIVDSCGLPTEKVLYSMQEYGNTSGASVPLTICANEQLLKKKEKVRLLMCGFGVGLSCGITYLEMETKHILPVGETNKKFYEEKIPKNILYDASVLVFVDDKPSIESILLYLDDCHADLTLCGQDEKVLLSLQERLQRDCEIVSYKSWDDLFAKLQGDKKMSGIVNLEDDTIARGLAKSELLKEQVSVVMLSGDKSKERFEEIQHIFAETNNNARVNLVSYTDSSMDYYEERNGISWAEKFIEKELSSDMIRPNYILTAVEWLLNKESRFISGSTICVSDKPEWF